LNENDEIKAIFEYIVEKENVEHENASVGG